MKILYITAQIPFGKGETFILEEMLEMKHQGIDLLIIPRNPTREIFHKRARSLLEDAIWLPLVNLEMIGISLHLLLTRPHTCRVLASIVRCSRTWRILIKNLAVVPKAVFITKLLKKKGVERIHAHWGSTTATMAYIASRLAGIPWSFTLHRWDITENNMLREKVKAAEFVRCISKTGKEEALQIVGYEFENKIKLIHMGVKAPRSFAPAGVSAEGRGPFIIVCPANLLEVKGHRFLVKACSLLVRKEIANFRCLLFGNGPLTGKIRDMIQELDLEEHVEMSGSIPHEKLMEMYENEEIDIVVLPSINTNRGDKEGIPVALMEAMAYRTPVISTKTGGIEELLSNGAGLIVEEKDSKQLADAMESLIKDGGLAREIGRKGYERVKQEFDVRKNVGALLELMECPRALNHI